MGHLCCHHQDGNGTITKEELGRALTTFGDPLKDHELKELFRLLDVNADGVIDYNEFIKIFA